MKLKLKVNDAGVAELKDGKPVYLDESGKEFVFDAQEMYTKIGELNSENQRHRTRAETAEGNLKAFEGVDVEAAKKAIGIVKNLDEKKLVDAGDVQRIKDEAIKAVRAEYAPLEKERDELRGQLHSEKIGGGFARSKFITDKLAIPHDIAEARFGRHFKLEDGKIVAYRDSEGKDKLFSRARPGELADMDEALELLVDAYPGRDRILKANNAAGGGAGNQGGGGGGNGKSMTRSQFDLLSPLDKVAKAKEGVTLTD